MRLVEPKTPGVGPSGIDLFLAGGISNCPDWQAEALGLLSATELTVANPRRSEGLEKTGPAAAEQIAWEHAALKDARVVLFWFPEETLCPITLLELGIEIGRCEKYLAIGTHPGYQRGFDVEEQIALARPANGRLPTVIHHSLEATVAAAVELVNSPLR